MGKRLNEKDLLDGVLGGDNAAMRGLYDCYVGHLTAVATRYLPEEDDVKDVLQEGFIKIFTTLGNFSYRGEGSLKAWMTRIVVNEAIDFLGVRKRSEQLYDRDFETGGGRDEADNYEEPDIGNVPMNVIYEMIRHLPDGYRSVFNLYVFEEKSHKDIAKMLKIKESTSASQLHRAKAMLAQQIKEYLTTQNRSGLWKNNG